MRNAHFCGKRPRLLLLAVLLLALIAHAHSSRGQAQEAPGCKMSDLTITADLPDRYAIARYIPS